MVTRVDGLEALARYLFDEREELQQALNAAGEARITSLDEMRAAELEQARRAGQLEELQSVISHVAAAFGVHPLLALHRRWERERSAPSCPF